MYKTFDSILSRVNAPVSEQAPLLKKYGMEGIGMTFAMMESASKAREADKIVKEHGLKWNSLHPPIDFLSEEKTDGEIDEGLEILKRWAEIGEMLGIRYAYNRVWSGSNYRRFDENFDWHVLRVQRVQRVTSEFGINYGLEWVGPEKVKRSFLYPFLNSLSGVLAIADAVDPRIGFVFDCYHWWCGGGRIEDIYYAAQHVDRLQVFHINDAAPKPREEQEDKVRAMPLTTGVIDAAIPYSILKRAGFTGPLVCEPFMPTVDRFETMPTEDVIREIADATDRVVQAVPGEY